MEESILKSTKKILNVAIDDPSFDLDIITHINNAFSNLHDIGIGPEDGFVIEGEDEEWTDFLEGDKVKLSKVKTVVYVKTRLAFDPPTSGFLLTALEGQLKEAEWRLNVNREQEDWVDPNPLVIVDDDPGEQVIV